MATSFSVSGVASCCGGGGLGGGGGGGGGWLRVGERVNRYLKMEWLYFPYILY